MKTIITIGDLFPHDAGMILVAKQAADGSPRHISTVANGTACGCECFGCGRRLIARNRGEVRAHSFAHRPEDMVTDCFSSGETALHLRAKEIIAKHGRITLPATFTTGLDGTQIAVSQQHSIDLTDIKLEAVAGELVPDVTATMPDGRRIFIEIANTHPCPPEKIEKLDLMDVEVLEIMVSSYRDVALDELDEIILDVAPRKLIHSSEVKAMAAEISEERQRREHARRAEAERLVAVYRNPAIRNHVKAQALAEDLVQYGLFQYIDIEDDRPSAFIIYRRQWQAAVLDRLYNANTEFLKPIDLLEIFAKGEWPKLEIAYTTSEHSRWIADNIAADFKSPCEEVSDYLSRLRTEGAVYEVRDRGFAMSHDLFQRIGAAIEKKNRPERRTRELKVAFRDVGTFVPNEDGPMPAFDHWLRGRAAAARLSVEQLLVDESGEYDALIEQMRTLYKKISNMRAFKTVTRPPEMAGLPIEPLINRLMTAIAEEARREHAELIVLRKRQADEAAELQRKEVVDRVQRLSDEAMSVVPDVDGFLDGPLSDLHGKTPRQLASESYHGFNQAQAALSTIRELKRAAERAENLKQDIADKLLERVHYRILRKEMADLWPKSRLRELGGLTPLEYCKDEKTLARCFEVLEDVVVTERKRRR
ncbi:hypothetical protein [Agrobacterium rosae]|uniref:Antitoxin Xre/MbcA/ParS-like toxin-binding domain-containing protein n=1 Tax=Agrobacterium rosae TaxID=1972867 RepID=A0A1R3T8F0_9HYPH|nr:hypothetical protein [Agrobacterium rosae]SCX03876.1 hypothetical protein DSM25559_0362 [Agrobacterium rosae]